jgi:hypothetical protein
MYAMTLNRRAVLAPYIRDGRVDYSALSTGVDIDSLLADVATRDLSGAAREEQLAFYLNAYNLLTLKQVLARLQGDPGWPGPVSLPDKLRFFALQRHPVAGKAESLMTLENRVIRRRFQEPRVHFALNCASSSCPHLPGMLFEARTLDEDLEALTAQFVHSEEVAYDPAQNRLRVSPIFRWYRRDFNPSVQAFIARYRDVPIDAKLAYSRYDWRLNAR